MKYNIVLFFTLFLTIVSCNSTNVVENNDSDLIVNKSKADCYIYYVDGLRDQLNISIRDYRNPYLQISWETNKEYADCQNKDATLEQRIKKEFSKNGFSLIGDISIITCCYAGVSDKLKIYSDGVIEDRPAGDNLSDFFFVMSDINPLAHVEYPSLTFTENWCLAGETVSCDTYFSKKANPFITVSGDYRSCNLFLVTAENKQYILDGTHNLFFELPLIGTKSDGSEISMVLKGSYLRP